MTTATTEAPALAVEEIAVQWPYRMSYDLYERIAELDVIRNEEHVVLLDGILMQTGPKTPAYCTACHRGREVLQTVVPTGWHVRPNQPVVLRGGKRGDSVPEPAICVTHGPNGRYQARHPEGTDVGLIVSIVTTAEALAVERDGASRYAHAAVPTLWIVALHDRSVHVYTEPSGPTSDPSYAQVEVKRPGELLGTILKPSTPDEPLATLGPIAVESFFTPNP